MDLEKEIKKMLIDNDMSVTDLAEKLDTTRQNLNNKLKRKDMKVSDLNTILEVLGYRIEFVKEKAAE